MRREPRGERQSRRRSCHQGIWTLGRDGQPDLFCASLCSLSRSCRSPSSTMQVTSVLKQWRIKRTRLTVHTGIMHSEDDDAVNTPEKIWDLTMNINVKGVWFGCKHAIIAMRQNSTDASKGLHAGGSIINVASFVAILGAATPQLACESKRSLSFWACPDLRPKILRLRCALKVNMQPQYPDPFRINHREPYLPCLGSSRWFMPRKASASTRSARESESPARQFAY